MVTRSLPLMEPAGCERMARYCGPPPRPTDPPRPWKRLSLILWRAAISTSASWALWRDQTDARRPASLAESEYPSMTSWCGCQPTFGTCGGDERFAEYHELEKSVSITSGDFSRSPLVSNSGTTRRWLAAGTPCSACRSRTASTSDASVAIEMTYAPNGSEPTSAIREKTSSTSWTLGDHTVPFASSGRFECSSLVSHCTLVVSLHVLYDPRPSSEVISSIASRCRVLSWRISRRVSDSPKVCTRQSSSLSFPSARIPSPVSCSDL
mmetsp:Transcript_4918/g.10909  ORF Transcript_4918/g.10909 Transcript_4918/m.10909 type:complete len:266 (+) Transcript_4918:1153-1950(+)